MHARVDTHSRAQTYTHFLTHTHSRSCSHLSKHARTYTHTHSHTHRRTHTHTYTHAHTHTYTHTHIHTHTHTHTYTRTCCLARNTQIETSTTSNSLVEVGSAWVQGHRNSMEDSHIVELTLDSESALLGVFDGHGGAECATYCQLHAASLNAFPFRVKAFHNALRPALCWSPTIDFYSTCFSLFQSTFPCPCVTRTSSMSLPPPSTQKLQFWGMVVIPRSVHVLPSLLSCLKLRSCYWNSQMSFALLSAQRASG